MYLLFQDRLGHQGSTEYHIKVRKLSILAFKCTFLGQNRLEHTKLIAPERQSITIIFIAIGIYNFDIRLISNTALYVIFLCSGIFFDYQMIVFVRKRNQVEPTELVPWKSVSPQDKVSEKMSCEDSKNLLIQTFYLSKSLYNKSLKILTLLIKAIDDFV